MPGARCSTLRGKMQYADIDTGEIHDAEIFVACLPATDYGFAMAVPSQKVEDFLYATERFFEHIGGVPKILVPDNLKSAVIKREKGMPELNKIFEDFCNHYGCVAIPARPVHPKDKSNVEDHVKIFYRRVVAPLRNETFYSIEDMNAAIFQKMRESNQRRMQQRPQNREELFLAIEKPNLCPLPRERYEVKFYTKLTVQDNCCVYLGRDMHYYSVPYKYVGTRMQVIFTATLVKIYTPDGELVREWPRDRTPGQYSTGSGRGTGRPGSIPPRRRTWLPTARHTGSAHQSITSASAGVSTRTLASWLRPCLTSLTSACRQRSSITAAMHCFVFRGLQNPVCLTSHVRVPSALTGAPTSLSSMPSRASVWASSRQAVTRTSSHRPSTRTSGDYSNKRTSHLRLI